MVGYPEEKYSGENLKIMHPWGTEEVVECLRPTKYFKSLAMFASGDGK